jgi:exodeoxyribonuclease VII small subunit
LPRSRTLAVSVFPRPPSHRDQQNSLRHRNCRRTQLEAIVDKLEQGDLSLDDSLRHFERGVQLTRACQGALKQAEQKVEILLRRSGADEFAAAPFDSAEDNER